MKKFIFILLLLILSQPSILFAENRDVTALEKSLKYGFTMTQTDSMTQVKHIGTVVKEYAHAEYNIMKTLKPMDMCPKYGTLSVSGSVQDNICKKEILLDAFSIFPLKNPRFFLIRESLYEGYNYFLFDKNTKKIVGSLRDIHVENTVIKYGKSGIYFLFDNNLSECHGRLYLLSKDSQLIEQESICAKESVNSFVRVQSFTLLKNKKIRINYSVSIDGSTRLKTIIISVKTTP